MSESALKTRNWLLREKKEKANNILAILFISVISNVHLNWSCRGKKKSSTNMLPIVFDCPFVSTPTCKTLKRRKRETKYLPFEIGTLRGRSRGRAGRPLSTSIASSASRLISSNHSITTKYLHTYLYLLVSPRTLVVSRGYTTGHEWIDDITSTRQSMWCHGFMKYVLARMRVYGFQISHIILQKTQFALS